MFIGRVDITLFEREFLKKHIIEPLRLRMLYSFALASIALSLVRAYYLFSIVDFTAFCGAGAWRREPFLRLCSPTFLEELGYVLLLQAEDECSWR